MTTVRFAHTSDWHLGYRQYNLRERVFDFHKGALNALNSIMEVHQKEGLDFVIHTGDIFHEYRPHPGIISRSISILEDFKAQWNAKLEDSDHMDRPIYAVRGNHDATHSLTQRGLGNVLDLLQQFGHIEYLEGEIAEPVEGVRLYGVGYSGKLVADDMRSLVESHPLEPDMMNILLLHAGVDGQLANVPSYADVSPMDFAELSFDYIGVGHYHNTWSDKEGRVYCPGSTEHTSTYEWQYPSKGRFHDTKRWFDVELSKKGKQSDLKVTEREFMVRPKGQFRLELKAKTAEEAVATVHDFVSSKLADMPDDGSKPMMRVQVFGALPENELLNVSLNELTTAFERPFRLAIENMLTPTASAVDFSFFEIDSKDAIDEFMMEIGGDPLYGTLMENLVTLLGSRKTVAAGSELMDEAKDLVKAFTKRVHDDELQVKAEATKADLEQGSNESDRGVQRSKRKQKRLTDMLQGGNGED